jgi:hypothetical protein
MQKVCLRIIVCLLVFYSPSLLCAQTILGDQTPEMEKTQTKTDRTHRPTREKSYRLKPMKVKHTPEYEYYARVEKVAKEKQRLLKKMATPQYSNPLYFGHKRPPKKHIASKMRYCKECGIRH